MWLKSHIQRHRGRFEVLLLLLCFVLLCVAAAKPTVPLKHNLYSHLIVIDITQSMNTADMKLNGKPVTRLEFVKQTLRETLSTLPCGNRVGLGMFSGVNVVALYQPIEVCANFSSLLDTLEHMHWRSAWTADSRFREGLLASAQVINNFSDPAQLVFLTDGEEAPKLHAFNTRDLSSFQNGDGWLIVGVGSLQGGPIPKYDNKNQLIGYWSHESMQLAPGAAPIAAAGILQRKSDLAESPQDRYLSKLAESYLQKTAAEIGATYITLSSSQQLTQAMAIQKPARREWAPYQVDWLLASLGGVLILLGACSQRAVRAWVKKIKKPHLYSVTQHDQHDELAWYTTEHVPK